MSYQLQSNTFSGLFVGQKIITLQSISSTNDFLKEQLSKSTPFPEGTAIMAEEQTAGRGQRGNTWHAEPGSNLMVSILLQPRFLSPNEQFWLNIMVSNALCKTLQELLGEGVQIKWPNDILFKRKKIGGILIENILQGSQFVHSIIGIGINVNQIDFPETLNQVTSIKQILHQSYSKEKLLYEICRSIEAGYGQLKVGEWAQLKSFYLDNMFAKDQKQEFSIDGVHVVGTPTGIGTSGRLIVNFDGYSTDFGFKEIVFLI